MTSILQNKIFRIFLVVVLIGLVSGLLCCCIINKNTAPITQATDSTVHDKPNVEILLSDSVDSLIFDATYLEIPQLKPSEYVITHSGFALSYNELHEQANWVAYELTKEETNSIMSRTDKFMVDPKVSTESATQSDYAKSGYDRGHLAPAADMGWSAESMQDCFYYSNMSPQAPSFNRGVWKRAEELMRDWAVAYHRIYIVTGPVLEDDLPTIGANKVSVPKYFYKVVLHYQDTAAKGIGFIIPNTSSNATLQSFVVSIDSVEKVTGIDFYHRLPDKQEKLIESNLNINAWVW